MPEGKWVLLFHYYCLSFVKKISPLILVEQKISSFILAEHLMFFFYLGYCIIVGCSFCLTVNICVFLNV